MCGADFPVESPQTVCEAQMRRVWLHIDNPGSREAVRLWGSASSRDFLNSGRASGHNLCRAFLGMGLLVLMAILPARDAVAEPPPSFTETRDKVTLADAGLANACVRAGKPKDECACTARIMRQILHPLDYGPSVLLQTASYSENGTATAAAKMTLARSGIRQDEVEALDRQRRYIVETRVSSQCSAPKGSASERRLSQR